MLRSLAARGIPRLSRIARATVCPKASPWAAASAMNDCRGVLMSAHQSILTNFHQCHRLCRFLSTRGQPIVDLADVWLEGLKLAWRLERYDLFAMQAKNAYSQQRGRASRESLESAAAAVLQAHADAAFVSRSVGSNEREVISAVRTALSIDEENRHGFPGLDAANAERIERLRSAGLLDALLSSATVRYLRAKQASDDFDLIRSHIEDLLDHDGVARQKEADQGQKQAKLEAAAEEIHDEYLLQFGLPYEYHPGIFGTRTWTPEQIDDWCTKSEAAGYRTGCGRTAAEFIRSACRIRPDMKSDDDCKEAACRILEAMQVLVHAMVLAGSVPLSDALILSGMAPPLWRAPESQRDRVLFSAIDAVMNTLAGYPIQDMNNMLLVGAKGVGKSSLLKSIGVAMAMIEFANPDVIICTAYAKEPCTAVPEAYLAAAMHARGVLPGDDGQLPAWCNAKFERNPYTCQDALESWIKEQKIAKGKQIVPILLLDEAAKVRKLGVEVADRFIRHVRAIAENRGTVAVRLTGAWSETPNFFYNSPQRPVLNNQKTARQTLQNALSTVEAQLMCLFCNPGLERDRGIAIARAVAKRMLEDDQLSILKKHGFLSRYPLLGADESAGGSEAVLITMGDAKNWRDADPDWEKHAQEGERLVEVLRHSSASIPRFLARHVDESVSDMLADRLRGDLSNDWAFAHFAGWLLRRSLARGRLQLPNEDFKPVSTVRVSDDDVLGSLRAGALADGRGPDAAPGSDEARKSVSKFLEKYNELGHIVTESGDSKLSTDRVVRFSSKLFLLIANAHLNHVGDNLDTLEFIGLFDASGNAAQDPVQGLVAEGLALNGLDVIGEGVGLEGTLGFRRLDCGAFQRSLPLVGPENRDTKRIAGLERLDIKEITQAGAGIPLNTILKEAPDQRKADLVAVCVGDSSDEAVVIRAQVKMGQIPDKCLKDAMKLAASWDTAVDGHEPVLSQLTQASNLRHIKKWTHLPLWLSAVDPTDRVEIEAAGVKVVSGEAFWRMAIPAVQLAVTGLFDSAPQLSEDEKRILLSQIKRPAAYKACVQMRADSDLQVGKW